MPDFRYALNASTVRTSGLMDQIRAAGAAGYDGIELWFDAVDRYLQQGGSVQEICAALAGEGLSVPTMIYLGGWFEASSDAYPVVREECKRRMALAADIGATYVIAGPPPTRADYRLGAQRYRELLEIGASLGVRPAMEFLGFVDQVNTIEEALNIMRMSERPDATTVLDPAHIYRGGGSVESIALLEADQIAICHFDDCPADVPRERFGDEDRVMPGDGNFDLKRYVTLVQNTGFRGFLSLELFRPDLWAQDANEVARLGLSKMKHVVDSIS